MSIPRFAIERPVMMTMISSIIILIGGISLSRLPVDLLPDISQPTVSVRVTYTGVGPLEMEDLVVRPLEQQLSAVSGLDQMERLQDMDRAFTPRIAWPNPYRGRWMIALQALALVGDLPQRFGIIIGPEDAFFEVEEIHQ